MNLSKTNLDTLKQLPVDRFIEAVKLAHQPQSASLSALRWLTDWWNEESGEAGELHCAVVPLIWVTEDGGKTYAPGHWNHGPAEPAGLFLQPTWQSAIAACGDSVLVVFLKDVTHYTLDKQGFLHTYMVNGTEYESLGIDYCDYRDEALEALKLFWSRFSAVYEAMA